jgi:hypothetical protein
LSTVSNTQKLQRTEWNPNPLKPWLPWIEKDSRQVLKNQKLYKNNGFLNRINDRENTHMKKVIFLFMLVLLVVLGITKISEANQTEKISIITMLFRQHGFNLWKYNPEEKVFQRTSSHFLNHVGKDYDEKFRRREFLPYHVGLPVISDLDNDGENEFVAIDRFGIIVCGQHPKYFPFEKSGDRYHQVLVEDLDKDGHNEFITQRSFFFSNDRFKKSRLVQIWKIKDGRLNEVWRQFFPGDLSWNLLYEDVDNDGKKEIITAYDTITILKKKTLSDWSIAADLPNLGYPYGEFTVIDVVRVGDVDGDGKNEILATGNSGALTVYKYRKQRETGNDTYPVIWQSPPLLSKSAEPLEKEPIPRAFTQGLGIGDVDNDGKNEILVGTMDLGNFSDRKSNSGGKIHIFNYKGNREFQKQWISDWTSSSTIPAITIGDVDGDQINEFIYNGQEVYKYSDQDSQYLKIAELDSNARFAVLGQLPNLQEPITSLRIIPLKWDLLRQDLKPDQTYKTSLSIKNVWAEAKNVSFNLKTDSDYLKIENGHQKLGFMKSGEIIDSQQISIRIAEIKPQAEEDYIDPVIWIEIIADGGYKQSVPITLYIELTEHSLFQ